MSMKKMLSFVLCLLILYSAIPLSLSAVAADIAADDAVDDTNAAVVYVDQINGSDDNTGYTEGEALQTLGAAFWKLESDDADVRKAVLIGTYEHNGALPAHSEMITICGDGSGDSEMKYAITDSMSISGPTAFENLVLTRVLPSKFINTYGSELVFGEGMTLNDVDIHFGNENGRDAGHQKLTLKSGTINTLMIGAHYVTESYKNHGGCDVYMEGGRINTVSFGSDGWLPEHLGTNFVGNCNFYVYGGEIGAFTTVREPVFKKAVNVFNYNDVKGDYPGMVNSYSFNNNSNGQDNDIEATEEIGVFRVVSNDGLTAVASSSAGKFPSADGVLTLAPGTYDLSFTDAVFYSNNGETIEAQEECTLDLTKEAHKTIENKIFLGWSLEKDGTYEDVPATVTLKAGSRLVARYMDYNAYDKYAADEDGANKGDFFVCGAEMRLADGDKPQGLRFITELKGNLLGNLPNVVEYGTAIYPSDKVLGRDMQLEEKVVDCSDNESSLTRYIYTDDALPRLVPAANIYEALEDGGVRYTVCVTGFTEETYDRFFTVKGYIKWKDYQGEEHVLLSDYYESNLYKNACALLDNGGKGLKIDAAEGLRAIKTYVEDTARLNYFKENYDSNASLDENGDLVLVPPEKANKVTLLSGYKGIVWMWHGGSGDSNKCVAATTGKDDARYKLYSLKNGLKIRDVVIDSGKSAESSDTIGIVQFADTHFNYLNVRDFEEKNPALMSTAIYRVWNAAKDGSASVSNGLNAVKYANFFDKAIVCGDMIDYLSWGSADMTKAVLFDRLYRGTFVLGNHEPTRNMQGKVADPHGNDVYDVLQHIWPTDIYYHSEILSDANNVEKVMCVSMYNASYCFYHVQIEKLAADIEVCREKNIPMLVFTHVPLSTNGNPDADTSTKVYAIYEYGDSATLPQDFSSKYANLASGNPDSKAVFELLVKNADVVKGFFNGDAHSGMYSEVWASYTDKDGKTVEYDNDGNHIVIPQYTITANAYGNGNVTHITVK